MDKKKLIKKASKRRLAPNSKFLLERFDKKYKGQKIYIITDALGKPIDIVEGDFNAMVQIEKSKKDYAMDQKIKEFTEKDDKKKEDKELLEKISNKPKKKSELDKLKSDPTYLRQKLDELYLNHDKKKSSYDELLDEEGLDESEISKKDPKHAKIRKLQNQYRTSINKLYKTATTYSHITGEDEKARAFQHVVGQRFEEELPRDVPTPQFQPRQDIKKLSDEELLKQLQRK